MKDKKPLFTVNKNDCRFDYFRCPGNGGQKVNKTNSGVRCTHKRSGAVGQSCDDRSQHKNKAIAFKRMSETKKFKEFIQKEVRRVTGEEEAIQRKVDQQIKDAVIEVKDELGRWVRTTN